MKNSGFTVIELLVVVVIVGILVGLSVPAFRGVFKKGRLEEARNEVFGLYQRTQRYATTKGINYVLQVDGDKEVFRCMEDNVSAVVRDSVKLYSSLDLQFPAGGTSITFTVEPDGFVVRNDTTRSFSIYDAGTHRTLQFYISPLGVMEVITQ